VGLNIFMRCKGSNRSRKFVVRSVFCALFLFAWIPLSFAQEPPLNVPMNRLPARDPDAIAIDGWLLYPTLRTYSLYSDNLFLSPTSPISVPGFGVTPAMTAVWSNGIHTTTIYGEIDRQVYPTDNDIDTFDRRLSFTQKYEALRDLIFSVNGDYIHRTWAAGLQSSIPTPVTVSTTTVLPNGNTVLPNGTILSPAGQVVGQTNPTIGSSVALVVDPFDRFTGTFSVEKIFNRGVLNLSSSVSRTDYEDPNNSTSQDTRSRTFTENAAFWLGPLFYTYSNGSIATVTSDATSVSASTSTTSYRLIGGLGTRQFGLFRASAYFGHQGSEGVATAGGDVYGGSLSYYPTPTWTLTGTVDRTINISSQVSATNLALTLPAFTPVQIAVGSSTRIAAASLQSSYEIAPQWFANCLLGYTQIEYVDSPRRDDTWLVNATLRYDIWRDMSLTWEYRYRSILSNAPLVSAVGNTFTMGAAYKF
jgi:putative beta-barrel porin BBP2